MKKALTLAVLALVLVWTNPVLAGGEGWKLNIEEAMKEAKKDGKDILVDFTGSDWCGWCVRLDKEVFSQPKFKTEAAKKFVFVYLDFPRKKLSAEQTAYNRKQKAKYGSLIRGFPTILLLDANGKPFGKTGYQRGGPEKYLAHLDGFIAKRKARDKHLAEAKAASGLDKARALDKALNAVASCAAFYTDLRTQIIDLDADDKGGLRSKHAYEAAKALLAKGKDASKYLDIVKKSSPEKAKNLEIEVSLPKILRKHGRNINALKTELDGLMAKKPTGSAKQMVLFYLSNIQYRLDKQRTPSAKVIKMLEDARDAAPNTRTGKRISQLLKRFKK